MNKRILSLLLAFLMLFSIFPAHSAYAAETRKEVTVWYFNSAAESIEQAETVELYRGGELYLSAILRDDISGSVQWQIEAEQDFWVDIQGGTSEDIRVSYGMVKSLLIDNAVRMRCAVAGGEDYYSDPFTVFVTDIDNRISASSYVMERTPAAPDPLPAPAGVPNAHEETKSAVTEETEPAVTEEIEPTGSEETVVIADESAPLTTLMLLSTASAVPVTTSTDTVNEDVTYHTVTIEYVYTDDTNADGTHISKFYGQRVALPYIAEVADGDTLSETVVSPNCVGYAPDIASIDLADLGAITSNVSYTVSYSPAEVSYTVRHYQQNVDDDEYTWVDTTMTTGYTEALTSDDAAKTYTGFTALSHYHEEIAADSSTMIDIYYDRNYYLMSFDLDGGYGVEAVYARYGASIEINSDPTKAGYTFSGWTFDGVNIVSLPVTMPTETRTYTAVWSPAPNGVNYTVVYWLQDANAPTQYNYWASRVAVARAESTVDGNDDIDEKLSSAVSSVYVYNSVTRSETDYYTWNEEKTDHNIEVKGDGSTVVNVYYDRNEYAFKFYYAKWNNSAGVYRYSNKTDNYTRDDTDDYKKGFDSGTSYYSRTALASFDNYTPDESSYQKDADGNFVLDADGNKMPAYEPDGNDRYYYFIVKARYGQNISSIWPSAPLAPLSGIKFVSWGTNYDSGYNKDNSDNKNIKGPYSVMDAKIIIDPAKTSYDDEGNLQINHALVAYWANPSQFMYKIYFSALASDVDVVEYPENSGNYYKLTNTYKLGSTYTDGIGGHPALSFNGVTHTASVNPNETYTDSETNITYTVYEYYYTRNLNNVVFDDQYGTRYTYPVAYGETLGNVITPPENPRNPASLPENAYKFGGWYSSPTCAADTEYSGEVIMPNNDLTYYADWIPVVYAVTITDGNGTVLSTEEVSYGSKTTKPTDPTRDDATFIGWYYKDTGGEEQRFDFDNMTITKEMTIYAKWRSNVMKQVEVYYVVEDENGNQTQIADTETLMLRLGQTRTFEAKTGSSLYAEYSTGCFPTTATHSITPTDADLDSDDPITYTFVYKQYGTVPYQVEFYVLEKDGTERPAFKVTNGAAEFVDSATYATWTDEQKQTFADSNTSVSSGAVLTEGGQYIEQHWQNDKAVVTELYVPDTLSDTTWTLPDEYLPSALKIQKIIVPSTTDPETNITANTIQFVYTYTDPVVDPDAPDTPGTPIYAARYLVQHYIQNSSGIAQYDLYSYSDKTGLSGETAAASPISIPGYTYSRAETELKKQDGTTLSADNVMSGTITADDTLELNFYYTVNSYPYQVMYLEEGTNRVLANAKTTDPNGIPLTGLYGSKVTENAIDLAGYDVVGSSTKTIYIQMEAGATASVNTIVFYYKIKSAELILTKSVELDATQAAQEGISEIPSWVYDQEFVFTVYQPEGYPKSVYHYTFTDANGSSEERTVNAGVQTIVVSLKHGERIQFHDFPMGSYTVTETYVPGFRTSVDGYIGQAHTAILDSDGEVGKLDFLNTFPFYTGDLVIKKRVTKLDNTDPTATEPYKVTVVLNPDDSTREVDRVITWTNAGATEESTFAVPALSETNTETTFTMEVWVPVDGEVKMEGVPVGSFTVTEEVKGTVGYIYDYYTIKYNKAVHENDEVTGTNHVVSGSIHGGHPTAVTFNNTYKKGNLTIKKTVTQEYANDNWQSDTFTFTITGTTELPDGTYSVDGVTVTVSDGVVTVKDADGNDPTISITKTDGATSWSGSLSFENLPAGYYSVTETAGLGNDKYTAVGPEGSLLVNDTTTATVADFNNTYKRHYMDLTITTTCADTEQSFIFDVSATGTALGDIHLQVVLVGNDSQTIKDLPIGTYTVTEQNEWSWRETAVSSQTVRLETQSVIVPFDFGVVDRIYWLSGYSYNVRKTGGG